MLGLRPARLPSRALAVCVDLVIVWVIMYLALTLALLVSVDSLDPAALAAVQVGLFVVVLVGLPIAVETLTGGRSVGKIAAGLRVVRDDGGPIRFRHALVRGAVGVVEMQLLFGRCGGLHGLAGVRAGPPAGGRVRRDSGGTGTRSPAGAHGAAASAPVVRRGVRRARSLACPGRALARDPAVPAACRATGSRCAALDGGTAGGRCHRADRSAGTARDARDQLSGRGGCGAPGAGGAAVFRLPRDPVSPVVRDAALPVIGVPAVATAAAVVVHGGSACFPARLGAGELGPGQRRGRAAHSAHGLRAALLVRSRSGRCREHGRRDPGAREGSGPDSDAATPGRRPTGVSPGPPTRCPGPPERRRRRGAPRTAPPSAGR